MERKPKVARVVLDLDRRVQLIEASEQAKLSVKQLAEIFNIGKTQVYSILNKKAAILRQWEEQNGKINRASKDAHTDINQLVWEWYLQAKAINQHVTGPMLQDVATSMAQKLGKTDFRASNGWLHTFRKRHQIESKITGTDTNQASLSKVQNAHTNSKDIKSFSILSYEDAVKCLKELQCFASKQNDSDLFMMASNIKVYTEWQASRMTQNF